MSARNRLLLAAGLAAVLALGWCSYAGETTDEYGMTGLMRAARDGDTARVHELLGRGALINREVASDDLEAFLALLAFFAEYPANPVGRTALMFAADGGHLEAATALLEAGADPDRVARGGDTALSLAVTHGRADLVRLLLAHGAAPDAGASGTVRHLTPLMLVAIHDRGSGEAIGRALVAAGADVNAADRDGNPVLLQAVRRGHASLAGLLVAAGARLDARDPAPGWTALMWAQHLQREWQGRPRRPARGNPYAPIVALLEDAGAKTGGPGQAGFDLISAILSGDAAAARAALGHGASPHAADEEGDPALHLAARHGRADTVSALLEAGAALHVEFRESSALEAAVAGRDAATVQAVLAGEPLRGHLQDALRMAAANGTPEIVRALLAHGASVEMGDYPLVLSAIRNGDIGAVQALLDAGADPDVPGRGETALLAAIGYDRLDLVAPLLAAGADPNVAGYGGKTALDLARRSIGLKHAPEEYKARYREVERMLVEAGARDPAAQPPSEGDVAP